MACLSRSALAIKLWRLLGLSKSAVICLGVCRAPAFNTCYTLAFAEPRHLTPVIPWRLPSSGKSAVICRDGCRASASLPSFAVTFAELRQVCRPLSRQKSTKKPLAHHKYTRGFLFPLLYIIQQEYLCSHSYNLQPHRRTYRRSQ